MRKLLIKVCLSLLIEIVTIALFIAQEHTHRFYTVYDGLSQSQVMCIAQDYTGYIWVGTSGGAARFEGNKFKPY